VGGGSSPDTTHIFKKGVLLEGGGGQFPRHHTHLQREYCWRVGGAVPQTPHTSSKGEYCWRVGGGSSPDTTHIFKKGVLLEDGGGQFPRHHTHLQKGSTAGGWGGSSPDTTHIFKKGVLLEGGGGSYLSDVDAAEHPLADVDVQAQGLGCEHLQEGGKGGGTSHCWPAHPGESP